MTLSKVTFLKNVFPIPKTIQQQLETHIFKHIWQFPQKESIARKTLYLPKTQGRIGLIQSQYHSKDLPKIESLGGGMKFFARKGG